MSDTTKLKAQVSIWEEEDPELFSILSPLDRGARSRAIRQMLRSAALINKGVYVLAGSPAASFSDLSATQGHVGASSASSMHHLHAGQTSTTIGRATPRPKISAPISGFPTPKMSSIHES